MNELKPCPFCGETPQIEAKPLWELSRDGALHGYVGHYKYDIRCQKCGCNVTVRNNTTIYSGHKKARENTIKSWNRRADQGQAYKVADLERELERIKQERDAAVENIRSLVPGWRWDGTTAEQIQSSRINDLERDLDQTARARDKAIKDLCELMKLTNKTKMCTYYCVNTRCYNRGLDMPCTPIWDGRHGVGTKKEE